MLTRAWNWLLDRTIALSFDRSGFRRHARRFGADDLAVDMHGRICVVTGANTGIGRAVAAGLAQRGADVWLLCRDEGRGGEAVADIRAATGNPRVWLEPIDLSQPDAIRACVARFVPRQVHVLVHNAGVLPATRRTTADGLEQTFATNVVGPFLLTHLLRPKLASGDARVIFVSSGGMYPTRLSLDDLLWQERAFDGVSAYAQTKRMQVVLAEMMARRFRSDGIAVHAMHPGWADTPGVRTSLPRFWRLMRGRLRTAEEGADTVLWLALTARERLGSGQFWFDRAAQPTHLLPWTRETGRERLRLWHLCERRSAIEPRGGRRRRSTLRPLNGRGELRVR